MVEKIGFVGLGGHILRQNEVFRALMKELGTGDYEFIGLEEGFKAFETGRVYPLTLESFLNSNQKVTSGLSFGFSRYSLTFPETIVPVPKKIEKGHEFVEAADLDWLVGCGGDDHGRQLKILGDYLKERGSKCKVLVANKTMDGDLGGIDGERVNGYVAPFTDTTNGFVAAVSLLANNMLQAYHDAWTNGVPVIVTHFGEDTNFVAFGAGWYGWADLVYAGELDGRPAWKLNEMADDIRRVQSENRKKYGRPIAMIVIPEGSRIEGVNHISENLIDPHRHKKKHPEVLAAEVKEKLATYHNLSAHTMTFTYELRTFTQPNRPYSLRKDRELAIETGKVLARAIREGQDDLESTIWVRGGNVEVGLAPIDLVTRKRFTKYSKFPWYDWETKKVRPEFGRYYDPLFNGGRVELEKLLPRKPQVVNVYSQQMASVGK